MRTQQMIALECVQFFFFLVQISNRRSAQSLIVNGSITTDCAYHFEIIQFVPRKCHKLSDRDTCIVCSRRARIHQLCVCVWT